MGEHPINGHFLVLFRQLSCENFSRRNINGYVVFTISGMNMRQRMILLIRSYFKYHAILFSYSGANLIDFKYAIQK